MPPFPDLGDLSFDVPDSEKSGRNPEPAAADGQFTLDPFVEQDVNFELSVEPVQEDPLVEVEVPIPDPLLDLLI